MASVLPGWNSIESATRWHKGFEIAGFIALGLLLACEILAFLYGDRKDHLLAERQTPRQLDAQQAVRLTRILSGHAGWTIAIETQVGDEEASAYAAQIALALKAAGIKVVDYSQLVTYTPPMRGVFVLVDDPLRVPPEGTEVLNALTNVGIDAKLGAHPRPGEHVALLVGHK